MMGHFAGSMMSMGWRGVLGDASWLWDEDILLVAIHSHYCSVANLRSANQSALVEIRVGIRFDISSQPD